MPDADAGNDLIERPQSPEVAAYWLKAVVDSADDLTLDRDASPGHSLQHGPHVSIKALRPAVIGKPDGKRKARSSLSIL